MASTTAAHRVLRIGIAGGGPAGLLLASILGREGAGKLSVRVFEAGDRGRDQGAGWDVDEVGQRALLRGGVHPSSYQRMYSDTFKLAMATPVDDESVDDGVRVCGRVPNMLSHFGFRIDQLNRECNRTRIVEGLLDSIEGNAAADVGVAHGIRIGGLVERDGGRVLNLLDDEGRNVSNEFDVVIDCLGVSSKLRRHRFASDALYTNCTYVQGVITDPEDSVHPEIVRRLGEGTIAFAGPGPGGSPAGVNGCRELILQRFGADPDDRRAILMAKLFTEAPGDVHASLKFAHGGQPERDSAAVDRAKELLRRELRAWPREYRAAVDSIESVRVLPVFMHPSMAETESVPGSEGLAMLSIGDALHALPPWSGMSGNFALRDASDTADALLRVAALEPECWPEQLTPTLRSLEERFMLRTEEKRSQCVQLAKRQATIFAAPFDDFDFYDYFGPRNDDGSRTAAATAMVLYLRGLTMLNRLENFGMRPREDHGVPTRRPLSAPPCADAAAAAARS